MPSGSEAEGHLEGHGREATEEPRPSTVSGRGMLRDARSLDECGTSLLSMTMHFLLQYHCE